MSSRGDFLRAVDDSNGVLFSMVLYVAASEAVYPVSLSSLEANEFLENLIFSFREDFLTVYLTYPEATDPISLMS